MNEAERIRQHAEIQLAKLVNIEAKRCWEAVEDAASIGKIEATIMTQERLCPGLKTLFEREGFSCADMHDRTGGTVFIVNWRKQE